MATAAGQPTYIKVGDEFVQVGKDGKPVKMLRYKIGGVRHFHANGYAYEPGEYISLPLDDSPQSIPSVTWEGTDPVSNARVAAARAKAAANQAAQFSPEFLKKMAEMRAKAAAEAYEAAQAEAKKAEAEAKRLMDEAKESDAPVEAPPAAQPEAAAPKGQTMSEMMAAQTAKDAQLRKAKGA
jgi:hypothetical protein